MKALLSAIEDVINNLEDIEADIQERLKATCSVAERYSLEEALFNTQMAFKHTTHAYGDLYDFE